MSTHLYWRSLAALMLGLCLTVVAVVATAATPGRSAIDGGWTFRLMPGNAQLAAHPEALPWHAAKVPGTVHTDLLANKLIPDPYVGAPEAGLQWIGLADWEYRTRFDAPRRAKRSASRRESGCSPTPPAPTAPCAPNALLPNR